MTSRVNFIIIGAMKSATSTLHAQLARQSGFVMSEPKEPCFFSNDEVYAKGVAWYESLFAAAKPGDLCGESSTHYTKLPTYPHTLERIRQHAPQVKLIYMMRHPIDRLVSQYVHEWTQRVTSSPIDEAIGELPILVDYSRYAMQLKPFLQAFGAERILPVFFERWITEPQSELERVCRFLGYRGEVQWDAQAERENASAGRLRKSTLRKLIDAAPWLVSLRRNFVPKSLREHVKAMHQLKEKPKLGEARLQEITEVFDRDLAVLGQWLDVELSCQNYHEVVGSRVLWWSNQSAGQST